MRNFKFRFAFALYFLLCAVAWAGTAPSGFLDIPWKASASEAKRIMAKREGVTVKEESAQRIVFQGGVFAAHPVDRWELELSDDQFRRGTVYVVIPPGNAPDGAPLRNHQFEDYYQSLTQKYGKGTRGQASVGSGTQGIWNWTVSDPRTGQKDTVTILLLYSWDPYEFKVQYSNQPAAPAEKQAPFGKPVKKGDL
jgi:hypothetical protein